MSVSKKDEGDFKGSVDIDNSNADIRKSSVSLVVDGDLEDASLGEDEEPKDLNKVQKFMKKYSVQISWGIKLTILAGWFVFLGCALAYEANSTAWGVFGFTVTVLALKLFANLVWPKMSPTFGKWTGQLSQHIDDKWKIWRWVCVGIYVCLILLFMFLPMNVLDTAYNLIPMAGYIIFLLLEYAFSFHRKDVKWRPIIGGFTVQVIFAVLILATEPGRIAFQWIGDAVTWYLEFLSAGSIFVYGETYYDHFFAFSVLPTVAYLSATVSILYYFGAIQWCCTVVTVAVQKTLGTSGAESLNCVGNIFLSMTEAPLLIKPFLDEMTKSELHAVMTGGFATVAGSVMGAYIAFGVPANHLLAASFMACPTALAISKLMYPETEDSKTASAGNYDIKVEESISFIEAASKGAINAIPVMLNIGAIMVAFISLLAAFDGLLLILGGMVGIENLTFALIMGYVFYPVCVIIGVPIDDCQKVASMIGTKLVINEFAAFEILSKYIENKDNGETDPDLILSDRAEIITTYALCSFANIGSIGIQLGGLSALAPKRAEELSVMILRSMCAGFMVSLMNAAVVSMMYYEGM